MSNYIICKRHMYRNDYAILFWGKDCSGYQYNVLDAGIYKDDDKSFGHYKDDQPVKCDLIDVLVIDTVIENRILGKICRNTIKNRKLLGIKLSELRKGPTNWNSKVFCKLDEFVKQNENIVKLVTKIIEKNGKKCH